MALLFVDDRFANRGSVRVHPFNTFALSFGIGLSVCLGISVGRAIIAYIDRRNAKN